MCIITRVADVTEPVYDEQGVAIELPAFAVTEADVKQLLCSLGIAQDRRGPVCWCGQPVTV